MLPSPAARGFRAATRAYGLLLDHVAWRFVDGWAYMSPRRIPELAAHQVTDRRSWDRLLRDSVSLQRRIATSSRVFERRAWLRELDRWHRTDKPAIGAALRTAARIDPDTLDTGGLLEHLTRCRTTLTRAIYVHHRYDVTPAVALGDLLANLHVWTGSPAISFLDLLRQGPRTVLHTHELQRLAGAIAAQPDRAAMLDRGVELGSMLEWLGTIGGSAAPAVEECLDVVGWWIAGPVCDVDERCLIEVPEILAESLRVAVARSRDPVDGGAADRAADVRRALAADRRAAFDRMLEDARAVHVVRDERALYCDVWATGVLRRALLAAGRRLAEGGRIAQPEHALEARAGELRTLLASGRGPSAGDLSARAHRRSSADPATVPDELGHGAWAPIALEWLPDGAARTERAFRTFLAAMDDDPPPATEGAIVGLGASPGIREGRARLVGRVADVRALARDDVLVASTASPSLIVLLPVVAAVVTDRGGMLSHAAIVARELGVPAVVGTGDATRRIADGARVRVDGTAGVVHVLKP